MSGSSPQGESDAPARNPEPASEEQLPPREIVPLTDRTPGFDPWAHRRTEPRPLAFFWSMFLAAATLVALGSAAATGIVTHDVYRPAVRSVLALIAVGLTVLWPMMRLSQSLPISNARGWIAKDLVVLLAPTQAVVWPQGFFFLAWWPWPVVAAVSALLAAWAALVGGVLALACDRVVVSEQGARARWMGAIAALALAGPVIGIGLTRAPPQSKPDLRLMTSAVTGVFELSRDRAWTGKSTEVYPAHWWAIGVTFGAAVLAWVVPSPPRVWRTGARGSLGVGFNGGARLDSLTTGTRQMPSKDPGQPGAADSCCPTEK